MVDFFTKPTTKYTKWNTPKYKESNNERIVRFHIWYDTNTMIELLQNIGLFIFLYMTLFFAVSLILKDASIVDIAWGIGFIVVSWTSLLIKGYSVTLLILCITVSIWGLRLSWHILRRKLKDPHEDFRYAAWRKDWGKSFLWRSFLQVFMLQGVIMLLISLPIIAAANTQVLGWNITLIIGLGVWLTGFSCESVADYQLAIFKKNTAHKGKIMMSGLWKYSRHPNYFGESVLWWGIWIMTLSASGSWWTVASPALLTYSLLFVSGVPMLERKYEGNQEFEVYKKRTSMFIPWFIKSSS